MPSKSKKQAKLMRAVAHGWKPSRIKGPTRKVAKEFMKADMRREGVKGYQRGGFARGVPGVRRLPQMGGKPQMGPLSMMRPGGGMPDPRAMPPTRPQMSTPLQMPPNMRRGMPMGRPRPQIADSSMGRRGMPNRPAPMGYPRQTGPNRQQGALGNMRALMEQMRGMKGQGRIPGPVTPPPRSAVPNTMYGGRNPMIGRSRMGGMPRRSLY